MTSSVPQIEHFSLIPAFYPAGPGQDAGTKAGLTGFRFPRLLKSAALGVSILAASLAVWPEMSGDLSARRPEAAL